MKKLLLFLLLIPTLAKAQFPTPTSVQNFVSIRAFYKIVGSDTLVYMQNSAGMWFPVGRTTGNFIKNGTALQSAANFNISGLGQSGLGFVTGDITNTTHQPFTTKALVGSLGVITSLSISVKDGGGGSMSSKTGTNFIRALSLPALDYPTFSADSGAHNYPIAVGNLRDTTGLDTGVVIRNHKFYKQPITGGGGGSDSTLYKKDGTITDPIRTVSLDTSLLKFVGVKGDLNIENDWEYDYWNTAVTDTANALTGNIGVTPGTGSIFVSSNKHGFRYANIDAEMVCCDFSGNLSPLAELSVRDSSNRIKSIHLVDYDGNDNGQKGILFTDQRDTIGGLYQDTSYNRLGRRYNTWLPSWGAVKSRIDSANSGYVPKIFTADQHVNTSGYYLYIDGAVGGSLFSINDVDITTKAYNTDFKDNLGVTLLHLGNGGSANYSFAKTLMVNTKPSSPNDVTRLRDVDSLITAHGGGASGANPTATIGFTAVNGSASTFLRSDGAPKADSTTIRSVANSYSLSTMQTKLNNYALTSALPVGANPTATAGATAVNGSATTFMRSDGAPKVDSSVFRTVANSRTLAQTQTALDAKLNVSDTTSAFGNLVHIAKNETITGTKTFSKAPVVSLTGIGTGTTTNGILIQNTTAAAGGAQQNSPVFSLMGRGWSGSASLPFGWDIVSKPTSSTLGFLSFYTDLNGTQNQVFYIDQSGSGTFSGSVTSAGVVVNSGNLRIVSTPGTSSTGYDILTRRQSDGIVQLISNANLPGTVYRGEGQTTLVSGTKAISITGVTTSSHAFVTLVSIGGTVTTTWQYAAVCTAGTVTITALTNAGTTDTSDTSILNYYVTN